MTILDHVQAETGLDLSRSDLVTLEGKFQGLSIGLAASMAERLKGAFPFVAELQNAVQQVMTTYLGITSTTSVLGVYTTAYAALGAAAGALEGRLDEKISKNYQHLENARSLTIERHVKPGDWATVVNANGPAPDDVDLYDNKGGWSPSKFREQYNAGIVWLAERPARSSILLPTWPSPPSTNGFGIRSYDQGYKFPLNSPLTGFSADRKHVAGQSPIAPIPAKHDARYFGTMPSASAAELAELQGTNDFGGRLKALERLIKKMEANLFVEAFVPPPDYSYLFSIGTYPYTSWSTANNNQTNYPNVTLNSSMAILAAGIHSLSPHHALVRSAEVERCYRSWLATSRLRGLPVAPAKQLDAGVAYLDEFGLPTAADPAAAFITFITLNRPGDGQDANLPKGYGPSYTLPVQVVRDIELSFRSFFRIRRAAIYQMDLCTDLFRAAAKASPDPVLRAAALGKPPTYRAWSMSDPLGDGWQAGKPAKGGGLGANGPGLAGKPQQPASTDDGGGALLLGLGALGLGGLVYALASASSSKRSRSYAPTRSPLGGRR